MSHPMKVSACVGFAESKGDANNDNLILFRVTNFGEI